VSSQSDCPSHKCLPSCEGEGHSEERLLHYEFERFRQAFRNRAQRRRLGVELEQDAAHIVFGNDEALYLEYVAWRTRTGRAPLEVAAREHWSGRLFALLRRLSRD
jgi:hypothetical protein